MAEITQWNHGPGGRSDPRYVGLVRVGDVLVDQRVQRTISAAKVEMMAAQWDWSLAEVPTLTRRDDGSVVVTEGQHRILALQQRDPDTMIWCLLPTDVEGLSDEAATALGIAKGRRAHNKVQEWKMRVTAGDAHEIAAEQVLKGMNLQVTEGGGNNVIQAAGTVMRIIHGTPSKPLSANAGAHLLQQVLTVCSVIPEEGGKSGRRYDSMIVRAVANIVGHNPGINLTRLAEKMQSRTSLQWMAFRRNATPAWRGIQQVIQADYNRGLRDKRI
jgi:hypothetical protein